VTGHHESSVLVLRRADLEALLSPLPLVDVLERAFRGHAERATDVPPRTVVDAGAGSVFIMPAASRAGGTAAVGTKVVTFYAGNRERGLPTHLASYLLLDAATGAPRALLEATFLTALRTGATSALAARYLARRDSAVVACFGTSVQAGYQLRCLKSVLPLRRAVVIGRDRGRAALFAKSMSVELGIDVEPAKDRPSAVRDADVITCATTASTPLFAGTDLRPGTHVDAVGAFRPSDRELDTETITRATVVVESYAGVLKEAGDVLIPMQEGAIDRAHIAAELAEVVSGRHPGRRSDDTITVFKSVGFALEDLVTAELAWRLATDHGVGTSVPL
jgi:ornithine cyclodeaminase/alanine dehydrogenase-like protein (mu-crystallin family)